MHINEPKVMHSQHKDVFIECDPSTDPLIDSDRVIMCFGSHLSPAAANCKSMLGCSEERKQ